MDQVAYANALRLDALPTELLLQIASYLDTKPPSITKFSHEPSFQLTSSEETTLKSLSQVSWRWRKITTPLLFKYTSIKLDTANQWVPVDARLLDTMQTQLTRLSNHEFLVYQKMRSKFKTSFASAFDEEFDDLLVNFVRISEDDEFFKSLPNTQWLPHLPRKFSAFNRFVEQNDLKRHIESVVVQTDKDIEVGRVPHAEATLIRSVAEIWSTLFRVLDPARLVVVASPDTLAGLLDTSVLSSDVWAFDMKCHYLELIQLPSTDLTTHNQDSVDMACRPWHSTLIHYRPWFHIGYNEGSSVNAYSTYEYHLKQSPKILYLILLRLAKEVQDCCNIRSFSFVAVFPFSTNVMSVIRALQKVRTLQTIRFQIAPGPENKLLSEPKRMLRAQASDLWMEWTENYRNIAGLLEDYDFENDDGEFSSGDCGEEGLADEVHDHLIGLRKRGVLWRKVGLGRWKRETYVEGEEEQAREAGPLPSIADMII